MVQQQFSPGGGGPLVQAELVLAEAFPETVPGRQHRRQPLGPDRLQQRQGPAPLARQQLLAGQLPLQIPAGGIIRPAIHHLQGQPAAGIGQGAVGLHRGALAPWGGQARQLRSHAGPLLLAEPPHRLLGLGALRLLLHHLQQQRCNQGFLGGIALAQRLCQQHGSPGRQGRQRLGRWICRWVCLGHGGGCGRRRRRVPAQAGQGVLAGAQFR